MSTWDLLQGRTTDTPVDATTSIRSRQQARCIPTPAASESWDVEQEVETRRVAVAECSVCQGQKDGVLSACIFYMIADLQDSDDPRLRGPVDPETLCRMSRKARRWRDDRGEILLRLTTHTVLVAALARTCRSPQGRRLVRPGERERGGRGGPMNADEHQ